MSVADSITALTRDPRFSPYATSAIPAWAWSLEAQQPIWANASGAALFDAVTPAEFVARSFQPNDPVAAEVARVAATLPANGAPRLGQFRIGAHALTCTCSRVALGDTQAILILGSEPMRPALPLAERVERLFAPASAAVAVFSADGALVYATGDLGPDTTLATLGAEGLKDAAIAIGDASGETALGPLTLARLGRGGTTVLVASLPESAADIDADTTAAAEPSAAEVPAAAEHEPSPDDAPSAMARSSADAQTSDDSVAPAAPPADHPEPAAEPLRGDHHPLRFVWMMDADTHFTVATDELADAMGARTADLLGRPWAELAAALALDPDERVAAAMTAREPLSSVALSWPRADGDAVTVELSGLPIFDRVRVFQGYRGFGLCRALERGRAAPIAAVDVPAAAPPADQMPPADANPPSETPAPESRPMLTLVPPVQNVVPFRASAPEKRPVLTSVERSAFHEIAETLGKTGPNGAPPIAPETPPEVAPATPAREEPAAPLPSAFVSQEAAPARREPDELAVLERLPVGVLIHRDDALLYVNHAFLDWTGYADLAALAAAGGLDRLVVDPAAAALDKVNGTGKTFTLATRNGGTLTCEGRHYTVPWRGESALMLVLIRTAADDRLRDTEIALRGADSEVRELKAILDTATDGIIVVDHDGLILTFNRSAEALFGYDYAEIARRPFTELFAPESERAARDYLDGLTSSGVASLLNDGREVIGRVRQGGLIPLFMTMGRIGEGMPKFCAVLRDITQWKRAEEDLLNAKRTAERASSAKSDFLAKISHEMRTPLNAIIGFSEVMMSEQFGPIGGERYREYLRDIHASGEHLVSLINDLLDLSKIEAGKLDLVFASVNLNQLVQQCVALMQPQANQQRIIIRSSLSPTLPPVVADARSVRQIVLNLLSNSIKFTGPGGQVIVSTALTDRAEAVLRVRDTGVGMTDKEIEIAMEPFRQLATSTRWGSGGTGLGLPLTKALAEANRASFTIKSARDAGTLVEITFPGTRVLAE